MPINALPSDPRAADLALDAPARWLVIVADDAQGIPRWSASLVHPAVGTAAETPLCPTRTDVEALLRRAERIAHIDDCVRRIDHEPLGLQFLLHDPGGRLLLIGAPRATPLERERALLVVKRSGRVRVAPSATLVPATGDA